MPAFDVHAVVKVCRVPLNRLLNIYVLKPEITSPKNVLIFFYALVSIFLRP